MAYLKMVNQENLEVTEREKNPTTGIDNNNNQEGSSNIYKP